MIHEYHCSVCQGSFGTRKEWLSHLLESNHQTKARKEISRWGQPERECVLVAFTTFPIASFDLLQFFSKGTTNLVTDFVWFANRPELGFVQFESKHKVEEILSSFGGPEVRINNQRVQIKKGGDCLELEWQLLTKPDPSALDGEFESVSDSEAQKSTFPHDVVSSYSNNAVHEERNVPNAQKIPEEGKLQSVHSIVHQYQSICQLIEIPEDEYKTAQEFLQTLQAHFAETFPGCQLIWFRNWYLKLQNTSPWNELIFFLDQTGTLASNPSEKVNTTWKSILPIKKNEGIRELLLSSTSFAKRFGIEKMDVTQCSGLLRDNHRLSFRCETSGLIFGVVTQPVVLPEIQACHLLSYFCSFDARVKPLLTVIRYWAKSNNISLVKSGTFYNICHPPDPAALDWLVIFFLCHKKKAILPTPQEIAERPHPKLFFENIDIGFAEDSSFAQQYSSRYEVTNEEVHVFNILSLAKMFFNFYSKVCNRKLVLNTKDAEVICGEEFVGDISAIKTKLTMSERRQARIGRLNGKGVSDMILLHPLYLHYGFSLCDKNFATSVCPSMRITGKKLKRALEKYKNGEKFNIRSALKVK